MSGLSGVATVRNEPRSFMSQQKAAVHDEHAVHRRGQLLDPPNQPQTFQMAQTAFHPPRPSGSSPKIQKVITNSNTTKTEQKKKDKSCVIS
jgi:hypothetical protein